MKESNREKHLRLLSKENSGIDLFSLSDKELKTLHSRISYLKVLSKENLDVDVNMLTDKELKKLYVIRQKLNRFSYHAI